MSAGGTTTNIAIGPGRLWVAPIGTAAPTSASAAPGAGWWPLGYTEEGTTVDIELTMDPIEVAEELDPVDYANSARSVKFNVALAEVTRKRMALALSLGAAYVDNAAVLDMPSAGTAPVGVALIWDSAEDATDLALKNKRWYVPKVMPMGTVSIARKKSPDKSTLPLELSAVLVTGSPLLRIFPNSDGLV